MTPQKSHRIPKTLWWWLTVCYGKSRNVWQGESSNVFATASQKKPINYRPSDSFPSSGQETLSQEVALSIVMQTGKWPALFLSAEKVRELTGGLVDQQQRRGREANSHFTRGITRRHAGKRCRIYVCMYVYICIPAACRSDARLFSLYSPCPLNIKRLQAPYLPHP